MLKRELLNILRHIIKKCFRKFKFGDKKCIVKTGCFYSSRNFNRQTTFVNIIQIFHTEFFKNKNEFILCNC